MFSLTESGNVQCRPARITGWLVKNPDDDRAISIRQDGLHHTDCRFGGGDCSAGYLDNLEVNDDKYDHLRLSRKLGCIRLSLFSRRAELPRFGLTEQRTGSPDTRRVSEGWTGLLGCKKNGCRCTPPWYGPYCQKQAYSYDYDPFGSRDEVISQYVTSAIAAPEPTSNLTFARGGGVDPNSCTSQCDRYPGCTGVYFDGVECRLITSRVRVPVGFTIHPSQSDGDLEDGNRVWLRVSPIVEGRVIGYWGRSLLTPHWNRDDHGTYINFDLHRPEVLLTRGNPSRIRNDSQATGIWSLIPFEVADFDALLRSPHSQMIIDRPNGLTDYAIPWPRNFLAQPLWAMYR